jgi:histidinol-phosphatase (PHP family)
MNCDYHIHSHPLSPDCDTPAEHQIARAVAIGMEEICLTDHLEINLFKDKAWNRDAADYHSHFKRIGKAGLRVRFGVEAGISCSDGDVPILEEKLGSIPLDFVIVSVHSLDGHVVVGPRWATEKSVGCVFAEYIQKILAGIKRVDPSCYSCVGHVDFPTRFLTDVPDPRMFYSHAADELDELFRHLISRGKCIEINTGIYRSVGGLPIPGEDWLGRYVELGGEFVTFGSDAHSPDQVGYRFQEAAEMAKRSGIKYFATYDKMQPTLHKL